LFFNIKQPETRMFSTPSKLALGTALLGAFALPAAAQTIITASSWVPPSHNLSLAQKEWCDLLEKNTAGKMKCNILPKAVSAPPGTFDAVRDGLTDISYTVHGYSPNRFEHTKIAEFPFSGNNPESTSLAFHRIAMKYPQFVDEHKGVKVLAFFTHGPGMALNTKKAVTSTADLTGMKWRVGGGMVNDVSKALAMNVTLKPAPESYELLSSGVMDGTLFPAESYVSFKIDSVIKHATTFPGGLYNTSFVFMMNPAKYDKLTADEKKAVDAISGELASRMFGRSWAAVDQAA
jgi:TRAP-type transport system periplasmic protein